MNYKDLSKIELTNMLTNEKKKYEEYQKAGLKLDISRGKPCKEQLDLSMPLLSVLNTYKPDVNDYRNYGLVDGIPELKNLFSQMIGVATNEILIGGNSSLNLMYDTIQRALQFGVGGNKSWNEQGKIKFLCPVPGYDRHFAICQTFGIEMIAVPMDNNGPIMDLIEDYVANDQSIKGMWCVPKFANPSGIVYSDEVVTRLANMKTAAKDFRIMWDDAYFIHTLYEDKPVTLKNILTACKDAGNPDRVYMFGSTSKITFAGAGVSFMASCEKNITAAKKLINIQTIGPDKLNQLAHYEFLKTPEAIYNHMKKHADIIRPKFDMLLKLFKEEFNDCDCVKWIEPLGGYFISFNVLNGCAKAVVKLCADAGLVLTPAGSTYPLMIDDLDSNIRIAPTFPTLNELDLAGKLFVCCVKIAVFTKLLSK